MEPAKDNDLVTPDTNLLGLGCPHITLDDVNWPIPKLAIKQNRIIVPIVLDMLPKLSGAMDTIVKADGDGQKFETRQLNLTKLEAAFDTAGIDAISLAVYVALTRAHPKLTRAQFDDMPIGTMELINSLMTVAIQTGAMRPALKGETQPGEA